MDPNNGQVGDFVDAKPFKGLGKFMRGTKRMLGFTDIKDFTDDELKEVYQRVPPAVTRKELLSDRYKMDYARRGKAVVINNKNFTAELEKKGYGVRTGTDIDATKICSRLKMLGFEVERYHDASARQMRKVFQDAAMEDHTDADCFVGVILSHGETDVVYGTDGPVELQDIFQHFKGHNCKTLVGKPKIFFIQACRGNQLDAGAALNVTDARSGYEVDDGDEIRIPNEADFLISYSTVPGYYSWRNSLNGSWYAQVLVDVLDQYGTQMDLQKMLTQVNKLVAYGEKFVSNTTEKSMHGMKQIPSFTSMLTKDLYFEPKKSQ